MNDVKDSIKNDYLSGIMPKELAERYDVSLNTIKSWIKRYGWSGLKNKQGAPSKQEGAPSGVQGAPQKRKRGGQPGNKNAAGHGAPAGNKNAEKFGFFSKYLPEETISIMQEMPTNPLDILWHEIQIAYAAIIRAQQIMYVKNREDKTVEKVEDKNGSVIGEKWEVQQAWDKHSNFLQAQAKAQKELRGLIKQYDEQLHKDWKLATEEQKARINQIKANTDRLQKKDFADDGDDGVEIINDAAEEKTSTDIGNHHSKVSGDIQQQNL